MMKLLNTRFQTLIVLSLSSNPHSGLLHIVSGITGGYDSSSAVSEALNHLFSYLVNSIGITALLPDALSTGLITNRQRTECCNATDPYEKAETTKISK